jgi:hypothetical protein
VRKYEIKEFYRKFSNSEVLAGGRSRTAEPWIAGPSSYPLYHEVLIERIILELPDELYKVEESYRIMRSSYNLNRKYSKSKSLNLNCAVKNLTRVSLDRTSVGLEPPIISLRV